jgi:hypothetical protein
VIVRELPAVVDDLPNICGSEPRIAEAMRASASRGFVNEDGVDDIDAAFSVALHMHQPLIPAGGADLRTADTISNLQWMIEHPDIGDNHNAAVFLWCYRRMGDLIPQLVDEGHRPRVMLDYSGTLLHGLRAMGAGEVFEALGRITCDDPYRQTVEWLGTAWGHAVAPSTPVQDFRLHVRAWQHHFAALFGLEALGRVRGFSPPEMALPNHPDVAYEFVKTLTDCGYQWVLVQEHTVEQADGRHPDRPRLPHLLRCTSSSGETASIVAIVKTQGSDTKLVGQMQPYYEARSLGPAELAGRAVPALVTQIADGENGGVMMNEFPPKYVDVVRECSGTRTPMLNASEYLGRLWGAGVTREALPVLQPVLQHRVWERTTPGEGPERLAAVIEDLKREDGGFHVDGGSWTNDISWVRGYEELLRPMEKASALFHERVLAKGIRTHDRRYRNALFHLLTSETSCYRYWGEGVWTDYGAELARRTEDIIRHDL